MRDKPLYTIEVMLLSHTIKDKNSKLFKGEREKQGPSSGCPIRCPLTFNLDPYLSGKTHISYDGKEGTLCPKLGHIILQECGAFTYSKHIWIHLS